MSIDYFNIKAPDLDVPLIELVTDDGTTVDFYNECFLRAVILSKGGLAFDFVSLDGREIRLFFAEVRDLKATQPADWMPEEADQIEHLLIRRGGPWPEIVFRAGGVTP